MDEQIEKPKKKQSDKKTFTLGTCRFEEMSPDSINDPNMPKAMNILLDFEEALKFNIAVDEGVRRLNTYNRSMDAGKRAALNLTIYISQKRIAVNEGKLKKKNPSKK